ncbi:MAG TPA: ABC transporter permease, partial [Pyrinomonadaceae bacterium]|nr:ABC transporter permease [Pyrinomonadaceae bacterium]
MGKIWQDLRYGWKMLLKRPVFTLVVVLTLALGIGATSAIFSVVNAVLLRPLPYPQAEQIVYFRGVNASQGISRSNISAPDYIDWKKQNDTFAEIAVFFTGGTIITGADEPERVPRASVSASFFSVLGVQPVLGRAFLSEEDQPNSEPVAVLSYGLWKRRFGSDANIINHKIDLSGRSVTVVGVMPAGYEYPEQTQIWTSLPLNISKENRDNRSLEAIGRIKPDVSLKQAQAQISAINARLGQSYTETNKGWDVELVRLHDLLVGDVRPSLLILLCAVAFVLLIACANVANLLLARATARQKEMAVRKALGASRARVVRQLLTESLLLSLMGGTLGLLLSVWLVDLLVAISPADTPRFNEIKLDYRVLGFTLIISCLTGLLFGLAPALRSSKIDLNETLKEGGRGGGESRRSNRLRSLLIVSEIALSLMLLVGAGLLIRSFQNLREVKPGFTPNHVLTMLVSLPYAKYHEDQQRTDFYRQLVERVEALPGVESAGVVLNLPLNGGGFPLGRAFIREGRPMTIDEAANAMYLVASPDYFRAMKIPLLAGRNFNDRDTKNSPMVVIINETMARRYFGSKEEAIGKRITIWRDEKFPREIVGVVGDTKVSTLDEDATPQMYVANTQDETWGLMALVVRTSGEPTQMTSAVRREVWAIDKDQPVYNVKTMDDVVMNSVGSRRVSMLLFSVFAALALVLAALGIYGVMAYSVAQRTHEIGIRLALGAQGSDVLRLVIRQGMMLTFFGAAIGLIASFVLTRLMSSLLFGVTTHDPLTFAGVTLLLAAVALVACLI